jgi:predicted RNA-binding Zn-ribbon protein involved in translation (DUF1610 family)
MEKNAYTHVHRYCSNCSTLLHGVRKANLSAKLQCPVCGAVIISTLKSRRQEVLTVYAPFDGIT